MITNPGHALVFGALDLLGNDHSAGWWIEATGEGSEFGNPEPIVRSVLSFLMDGAIEATEGHGNREMPLRLKLEATSSANLALAEAALFAEVGKRNTLTWTPPDSTGDFAGTPSVFQVVNSSLTYDFDDINELHLYRIYVLTIKALPFAFSQTLVSVTTDPPVATTPVNTLVDNCSSTTGWAGTAHASGFGGVSFASTGGIITLSQGFPHGTDYMWVLLNRTGLSATMTSTPFVRVKMNASVTVGGTSLEIRVWLNGGASAIAPVARDGDYYWYVCPSSPLTAVAIEARAKFPTVDGTIFLNVDEIYRTDTTSLSAVAGQRQQFVSLPVAGSARTQGRLDVVSTSGSTSLGSTLVYTNKDVSGFQPDLRRRLVAGPTETADTSLVSQKSSPLSTSHSFLVPSVPTSGYLLMARVKHASAATYTLTWGADVVPVSAPTTPFTGTLGQSGTQSVVLAAGVWTIVPVAKLVLPTASVDPLESDEPLGGETRITLSGPSGVLLDEAWLFDVDNGRLTWAELGTGSPVAAGPYATLYLLPATVDDPAPRALAEGDTDVPVGAGGMLKSFQAHEFVPPLMNIFVVTTGSTTTALALSYWPAYFTHAVLP